MMAILLIAHFPMRIFIILLFLASEVVQNVSAIIGTGNNTDDAPRISSRDVELVRDILNRTLQVAQPTAADRDNYMQSFNSLQDVDEAQLRAANQQTGSVQG